MLVSVAKEEGNSDVSRDYHVLRRMIDDEEQFIEVTALGEELAEEVIRYLYLVTSSKSNFILCILQLFFSHCIIYAGNGWKRHIGI